MTALTSVDRGRHVDVHALRVSAGDVDLVSLAGEREKLLPSEAR